MIYSLETAGIDYDESKISSTTEQTTFSQKLPRTKRVDV